MGWDGMEWNRLQQDRIGCDWVEEMRRRTKRGERGEHFQKR